MFENFMRIVTGERKIVTPSEQAKATAQEQKVVKQKFFHDIQALKEAGYTLSQGKQIVIDLKEALNIIPRDRKRVDAYKSLVDYLNKEFGIKLFITSQKTKKDEI